MKKDKLFWVFITLALIIHLVFLMLKPTIHLFPRIVMLFIIKVEMGLQIFLGFSALKESVSPVLYKQFTITYIILVAIYFLLKIPLLEKLNDYYIVVPAIFTPMPFVVTWMLGKGFDIKE